MLLCALFALLMQDAPAVAPHAPHGVTLPRGPAASAWHVVADDTPRGALAPEVLGALDPSRWREPQTWSRWAEDLAAEAEATPPDSARRERLVFAALAQGRSESAWDHCAALSADPAAFRAVLPALLPGVPSALLGASELPDGVVLSPALPPLDRPTRERLLGLGRLERREMKLAGLRIGAALVDMRVAVEYDGVQVDFDHRSGGEARVSIVLPEPLDFDLTSAHLDWERTSDARAAHVLTLKPGAPTLTLYGRCRPLEVRWPTALPEALDERLRRHGFELTLREGDDAQPRIEGFAAALARLVGVPARVRILDPQASAGWPGVELQLADSALRERKLRGLLCATEHYALRRR